MKRRIYTVLVMIILIVAVYIGGCTVSTPRITGIVIDKETKQPVENAWVRALVYVDTATPGGPVNSPSRISPAHMRTGKDGTFVIPFRMIFGPPPPFGFWATPTKLFLSVRTSEDKRVEMDLIKDIKSINLKLTLPVEYPAITNGDYRNDLQHLSSYCETGRLIGEWPPVEGGCDKWELDYAINAHKRFMGVLDIKVDADHDSMLWGTRKRLAYLYKLKGDYKESVAIFQQLYEADVKRGSKLWLYEYETQIKELQQKLKTK